MKKILFVSYNHAKPNVADSVQNHRLIGALRDYYEIDVLQRAFNRGDEGVWSPDLYFIDRVIYKIMPFLISVFSIDAYVWCRRAFRQMKNRLEGYDAVIMVYEPYTTRYLQYNIKTNNNTKILSILYDPYYDNIFFSPTRIGKYLRRRVEKHVVDASEAIVVNNKKVLNYFQKRYVGSKVFIIDFCGFDEGSIPKPSLKHNTILKTIVHCGNVFGERRIDEINEVVSILKQHINNLSSKLQILFVGTYCLNYEKVLNSDNQDVIKHVGAQYGDKLYATLKDADGLLLIDPLNENNCCLPSKLSEYYQYGKPIFAISAKNTPSYVSLKNSGQIVCYRENLNILVKELYSFVCSEEYSNDLLDNTQRQKYTPKMIAKEYTKIIDLL